MYCMQRFNVSCSAVSFLDRGAQAYDVMLDVLPCTAQGERHEVGQHHTSTTLSAHAQSPLQSQVVASVVYAGRVR